MKNYNFQVFFSWISFHWNRRNFKFHFVLKFIQLSKLSYEFQVKREFDETRIFSWFEFFTRIFSQRDSVWNLPGNLSSFGQWNRVTSYFFFGYRVNQAQGDDAAWIGWSPPERLLNSYTPKLNGRNEWKHLRCSRDSPGVGRFRPLFLLLLLFPSHFVATDSWHWFWFDHSNWINIQRNLFLGRNVYIERKGKEEEKRRTIGLFRLGNTGIFACEVRGFYVKKSVEKHQRSNTILRQKPPKSILEFTFRTWKRV